MLNFKHNQPNDFKSSRVLEKKSFYNHKGRKIPPGSKPNTGGSELCGTAVPFFQSTNYILSLVMLTNHRPAYFLKKM